jgi:nitroreductase
MDTYRAITAKRDTREYTDQPIPEEVKRRILRAGRMAGSAKNAQPVRLIAITDPGQKAALAKCGNFTPHVPNAPLVVALVLVPEEGQPQDTWAYFRGPFDAGRSAQTMMLAAWAEGITSCPATMHDAEAARAVLGLPAGYYVVNTIAFGYPEGGEAVSRGLGRLPSDDVIHRERWEGS